MVPATVPGLGSAARRVLLALCIASFVGAAPALASESWNRAPGFEQIDKGARIVVMPLDVELFSLTAGGVSEPKADWTAAAIGHMKTAVAAKATELGINATLLDDAAADEFAEQIGLQAALARSIALHHMGPRVWRLPSKEGVLDWSLEDSMRPIAAKTGARYGLFFWVRDSYATAERKAAMVVLSLLQVRLPLGQQAAHASLVDLQTGRVVWFNSVAREKGDLRDVESAADSVRRCCPNSPR